MAMLFALPEYAAAAGRSAYVAIHELARARSPLLSRIESVPVESIPVARFSRCGADDLEITPTQGWIKLEVEIPAVVDGDLGALLGALDAAAEEQERVTTEALFAGIQKITDMTGNKVDASGRPISWDLITDTLETMEIRFDEDGEMDLTLVMNPRDLERLQQLGPPTAEQQARHDAVLEAKRREWEARKRERRLT
jgi:hypothetical protein